MNRNYFWKFLLIMFIVSWAIFEMWPPTGHSVVQQFRQDARNRDATFTNILERAQALEKNYPDRAYANLKESVGTNDITRYFPNIDAKDQKNPDIFVLNMLQRRASGRIRLGLDLQGGTSFLVGMDTNKLNSVDEQRQALNQAVDVLRRRVDKFGVAEPLIQPAGNDRILIQLPGLSEGEMESVKETIQRPAALEFRLVHTNSEALIQEGIPVAGYERMIETIRQRDGKTASYPLLVSKDRAANLTGKNIKSAMVTRGQLGEPEVVIQFDSVGADAFGKLTEQNVGRRLAIVLDGELYSAPSIREPILGGSCRISGGNMDEKEAFTLENVLQNPLEAPVKVLQQTSVDPSLGKDSIHSGIKSAIYGVIAVAGFMAVYYLLSGLVANVALLLNIIILLGVMASVQATLTLPGIAGIVLTIGMAVDANVLIFERIREELAAGKSLRGALSAGYDKAFSTIFDTNLTTLISGIILIFMGSGPVKGFGVTLTIGIATSMFTALVVTRLVFDWLLMRGWLKSLPMLRFLKETHIDFLRWAIPAFILSWALILVGMGYGVFARGHNVMGVDFAGGDSLLLQFQQRVDVDKLRQEILKLNVGDPLIQYQQDLSTGRQTLRVTTEAGTGDKVETDLKKAFPEAHFNRILLEQVGATVSQEIQKTAIVASLLAIFGILVYVAFRYELSFAVGAVIAIFHDVLMTLGWFFLTDRQLSASMVAAILTIIGFSINDTIVIFDRIREDLKLGVRGTLKQVMNQAINQTLSRTIITSGTVLLATLSLYIFGGGVINDFAFTFLVGIITGTYSSIYIASAIVLWWHKGQRPKLATRVTMDQTATARV